jgi:xanthine/CO dehydrogenase XdhC/CoxF family maturation factor
VKEIREIIKAFDEASRENHRCALATVVHVDGSSYRRPGARMLVTDEGKLTGAISGGCLEGDALRKALLVLHQQKSMLVTYDTNDEDDAKFGAGLGCNGIIQVLIEPILPEAVDNPIELLRSLLDARENAVLATVFSLQQKREIQRGTCLLVREDRIISLLKKSEAISDFLMSDAKKALSLKSSAFRHYVFGKNEINAFIEIVRPPISLVVIGAGNDTVSLIKMADILGWNITVADGRPSYAKPEKFVPSCKVIVAKPETVLENLQVDEQTAFILMTHNYPYDLAMLKEIIQTKARYIGSLGPRKKLDRMIKDLNQESIFLTEEQTKKIYGPAGLDIGAETPEEIALSIIAEIRAVFSNHKAGMLREKESTIHSRSETEIEKIIIKDAGT